MGLFAKREPEDAAKSAVVWRGAEALRTMLMPISEIRPDERNARRHPDRNIEAVMLSLSTFGQRKPIVVREGVAIAGNGTHVAATRLGWTHLAAADASDLTREQALAYAIADNKSGDLAEWDFQELSGLLRELPAELLDATAFAEHERIPLLSSWTDLVDGEAETNADGEAGKRTRAGFFQTTEEQALVIRRAIERLRETEGQADIPEGRALELICAEYLSGA